MNLAPSLTIFISGGMAVSLACQKQTLDFYLVKGREFSFLL